MFDSLGKNLCDTYTAKISNIISYSPIPWDIEYQLLNALKNFASHNNKFKIKLGMVGYSSNTWLYTGLISGNGIIVINQTNLIDNNYNDIQEKFIIFPLKLIS